MDSPVRWGDLTVEGGARRREIRRQHRNGLDTVEVSHGGRRLVLTFLERAPDGVRPSNVRIEAPPAAPPVVVTSVRREAEQDPRLQTRLLLTVAAPGGPGRYTLRLVERAADGQPGWAPLRGLDPRFAQAGLTFDVDQPNPVPGAGPASGAGGADLQASYLARDYAGLRQLILDRMAQTMPAWTERHAADIGITLVELLAYAGDDLSYYQDAVATEAYLQTARNRISVRRHARLTGYQLGEGCQARAWLCLAVADAVELPLREVAFAVAADTQQGASPGEPPPVAPPPLRVYSPVRALPAPQTAGDRQARGPTVTLRPAHNQIALWAWGERDSWLPAGATHAVLADAWTDPAHREPSGPRSLSLAAGDVIVFEATCDPSGIGAPDPAQRHPVRLTAVQPSVDRLYEQPILEVTWTEGDALPFDLQVTAPGPRGGTAVCAVVRGNTILAGDGRAVAEELPAGTTALGQPQLTWACPYPDPGAVARHQARLLRGLPHAWREQVEGWLRAAEDGEPLSEQRLTQLRRLLGADVLAEFGLHGGPGARHADRDADDHDADDRDADDRDADDRDRGEHRDRDDDHDDRGPEREAEGLRRLLLESGRLLESRVRRLAVLAGLARASGPLEPVLLGEVADDWGEELARPLSAHHPAGWGPAADATSQEPGHALPLIRLAPAAGPATAGAGGAWTVVPDLVGSLPGSRQVMVEMDDARIAHLRFSPADEPAGPVEASYQVGQGSAGNVPAEAINSIITLTPAAAEAASAVQSVRNPLPASGGTDPETLAAARAAVPGAFLIGQPRALVAADYTAIARRAPGVRRAATVLRWTGTRYAAEVTVQPAAGEDPSQELLAAVGDALWPVRRIGHDLWVRPPRYRPLLIGLNVDIGARVVRAHMTTVLSALLSSGVQRDGVPGLFSPVRLGFGQPVYASPIIAAVQDLPGVEAVVLTRFGFLGPPGTPHATLVPERLRLRPGEIARLDNDPAAPERGYATINLRGGR